MIIDHIGVAVANLDSAIRKWHELFGYRPVSPVVTNTRQKVRVVFLAKPDSLMVKLFEPSSEDSPVAAFARRGGGLHHLCFRCQDLDSATVPLRDAGARFLVAPEPGEEFCGNRIAFCLAPGNLNIELIDTEEKCLLGEAAEDFELPRTTI